MGVLTREQINAIDDLTAKIVEVQVPEWGGSVYVRPMTVSELDAYSNASYRAKATGLKDFRSMMVACCLCDEKGNRLFSDAEVEVLARKSGPAIDRIYRACDELNDISPKKLEETAGNSNAGQSDSSSSDSPATSSNHSQTSTGSQSPSSGCGGPSTSTLSHSGESGSRSGESSQH